MKKLHLFQALQVLEMMFVSGIIAFCQILLSSNGKE